MSAALPVPVIQLLQVLTIALAAPGVTGVIATVEARLHLRGRGRSSPWSGFGLAVGSLTLAGLPPTVGFVSEWFLLESLMQQFRCPPSATGWCSRWPAPRSP